MRRTLGKLWPVSQYTLGGGGIGQVWGTTARDEAVQTVQTAIENGVNLLDLAPLYGRGEAEAVVGEAFGGHLPEGTRVTSKCLLGTDSPASIKEQLEQSITKSLKTMKLEQIDVFFLHSQIIFDDYVFPSPLSETQQRWSVTQHCFNEAVRPAFEDLKNRGLINAWGITGTGHPDAIEAVLQSDHKPDVVQIVTNLLDSPGSLKRYPEAARPRSLIQVATEQGVGVMGIRAVQAGALTSGFDRDISANHPEMQDFERAAPFRELCNEWGSDPAVIAHQYALAMAGVDTVVLGVKNRQELLACLDGAAPLEPEQTAKIDALGLQRF
jgi:aryl-alcohol dehydrogenase-like predicted oxidoreductase